MISALILAEGEHHSEHALNLPFADFWFGVIALCTFMLLLGITWAFRNTAAKLGQHQGTDAHAATGHHGTTGATRTSTHGVHR